MEEVGLDAGNLDWVWENHRWREVDRIIPQRVKVCFGFTEKIKTKTTLQSNMSHIKHQGPKIA